MPDPLTDLQVDWTRSFTGLDLDTGGPANGGRPDAPPGQMAASHAAPGGVLSMRGPLSAETALANFADADFARQTSEGKVAAAAKAEAEGWVRTYLANNRLRPLLTGDLGNQSVLFNDKAVSFDSVVATAAAAASLASLKGGEAARALIAPGMVTRVARDVLGGARHAVAPPLPAANSPRPKGGDDDPEVSVEIDPVDGKADTQIQYTVKLRASNDDSPPKVQFFPDVEVTVHVGEKVPSIETQLNVLKADIAQLLHLSGKVKIEASVGVSAEMNIANAAAGDLAKSFEVKLKSEISIGLTKHFEIKPGLEQGLDGKPKGGVGIVWKF